MANSINNMLTKNVDNKIQEMMYKKHTKFEKPYKIVFYIKNTQTSK